MNQRQPMLAVRYRWNDEVNTRVYTRSRIMAEAIVRAMRKGTGGRIMTGWIEEVTDEEELKEVLHDER